MHSNSEHTQRLSHTHPQKEGDINEQTHSHTDTQSLDKESREMCMGLHLVQFVCSK